MPMNVTRNQLRRLVAAIGIAVAIATAISIPAVYLIIGYSNAAQTLEFRATIKANRLSKYIYVNRTLWQYQNARLAELIELPEANEREEQQRVKDNNGKIVLTNGTIPPFPTVVRAAPVIVAGSTVGQVELTTSVQPLLERTAYHGVLSFLLGFLAYFALKIFPLRVLDQTLGALDASNKAERAAREQLADQNTRFDAAINNMSQGLLMFDANETLVVCNRRYIEMYDLSSEVVKPGCTLIELFRHRALRGRGQLLEDPEQHRQEVLADLAAGKTTNKIVKTSDGREISITNHPMANGGWVVTQDDITERRRVEKKIAFMARHDSLTNLPNRLFFREQVEQRFAQLGRNQRFAVLSLDLDHFKHVNDTLGHPIGDMLLRQVGERLRSCLREVDGIARIGGDEFVIMLASNELPGDAVSLATRLISVVSKPYDLDGQQGMVGVSVGIAVAPTDAKDPDHLLKCADLALYRAKSDGRGTYRFFEAEMDAMAQARRKLELDLRRALVKGEFELYYQPSVSVNSNQVIGFEALLRWHHPERGMIAPLEFIPLAETTGLIVPLGEWVLRKACADAASWPTDAKVAVNLSAAQFKSRTLVATVISALAASGLPARRLELEITESVLLQDNEATLATLHQLRDLGVSIAMDDFGTGYSSLSYLRKFPFDKIKIDCSFVQDMVVDTDSHAIVRAIAALGKSLGMETTAEGVETAQQYESVKSEGCTEVQGYLFSPPVSASEITKLLRKLHPPARALAAG